MNDGEPPPLTCIPFPAYNVDKGLTPLNNIFCSILHRDLEFTQNLGLTQAFPNGNAFLFYYPLYDKQPCLSLQFLAIDSDRYYINDETFAGIDPVNEFLDIGCNDIDAILGKIKILRQTPSLHWLSDRIPIYDVRTGAGGVRQVGRLLMMMKSYNIKETIVHKVKSALQGIAGAKLNIHIFTGMGGGTGSGVFLDICYIIRHIIQELAIGGRTEVAGYFFLPDVNIGRVPVDAVRKYITINGYAAMKELDYCMNFNKNGGEWNQEYVNYKILSKQAPGSVPNSV